MKKLLLLIAIFNFSQGYSQDKFEYNQNGLIPKYLVIDIENSQKDELYKKTLDWIKINYKNPNKVIQTTIENEMVRIEGVNSNWFCGTFAGKTSCADALYTIEIQFRKGRYKIEVFSVYSVNEYNKRYKINLESGDVYYKKSGKLKKFSKDTPTQISSLFNDFNNDLKNFIKGKNTNPEDW
jgi:hypothetical protein